MSMDIRVVGRICRVGFRLSDGVCMILRRF